ncbi:hypothetical protein [Streptomyces niveus]|uniref:hypothetical protein n=1 Tax=Streptomyces niveus TaxID=193462 RepID=UPI0036D307C0
MALEQLTVLARKFPGMLADELSDYLCIRITGHINSLMTLINGAASEPNPPGPG